MLSLEEVRRRAESDARTYGYFLHPDSDFLKDLLEGLKKNWDRYGYPSCPCRLATGSFELDRDILCPCDYRDPDVLEYGNCYCALYVSKDLHHNAKLIHSIPERRPLEMLTRAYGISTEKPATSLQQEASTTTKTEKPTELKKLWYCKQCGYVIFRENPPFICPVCKARQEMFTELSIQFK